MKTDLLTREQAFALYLPALQLYRAAQAVGASGEFLEDLLDEVEVLAMCDPVIDRRLRELIHEVEPASAKGKRWLDPLLPFEDHTFEWCLIAVALFAISISVAAYLEKHP